MKKIHIVATGVNGEIGYNNNLLWHIPADLQYFKNATNGHVLLVGRKTLESLPTIRGRYLIALTNQPIDSFFGKVASNVFIASTLKSSLDIASRASELYFNQNKFFIIGGEQIYKATEDVVDEIWQTQVNISCPDADAHYHVPEGFEIFENTGWETCPQSQLSYRFVKWKRSSND